MHDRVQCCIPGCRRTTAERYAEWICAKHWQNVSRDMKRVWARMKRRNRSIHGYVNYDASRRIWARLKREAM